MTYTEQSIIDQITVTEKNELLIRRADLVLKDGVEISKTYHRVTLLPNSDLTGFDEKITAIANAVWK